MKFFKRIFSKPQPRTTQGKSKKKKPLYFHEDRFCQVEIVPRENSTAINLENGNVEEFSKVNFDGFGFSDIYQRGEHVLTTKERKIVLDDIEATLIGIGYKKNEVVYTGYGSYKKICENTIGYEVDSAIVFASFDENRLVEDIWLDNFRFNSESTDKQKMVNGLYEIGCKWNLILNDWDLCKLVDLQKREIILQYVINN
jgi:hypothetical protein